MSDDQPNTWGVKRAMMYIYTGSGDTKTEIVPMPAVNAESQFVFPPANLGAFEINTSDVELSVDASVTWTWTVSDLWDVQPAPRLLLPAWTVTGEEGGNV